MGQVMPPSHLPRLGEQLNDARMGHGHHALPIDLDDAVSHADTPALGRTPTQQTADLGGDGTQDPSLGCGLASTPHPARRSRPHDAILHAEAQLLAHMGPPDDGRGDRRAVDDTQCH